MCQAFLKNKFNLEITPIDPDCRYHGEAAAISKAMVEITGPKL